MNEKFLTLGSTVTAFVASLCCLGPLILGGAGLGVGLVTLFAPLRPYFLALSGLLLALGFYFVYRRPKTAPVCAGDVCVLPSRAPRLAKPLLWLATTATAALALFPAYGEKLVPVATARHSAATAQLEIVELKIRGMDCEVCAVVIQRKLAETPGVTQAEVHYASGSATVKYDPRQLRISQLIEAIRSTGYQASLINGRSD